MKSYISTKSTNFDTNISEGIKHHNKVVDCKNYELDSRSLALKNYNYRPDYQLKKAIEEIQFQTPSLAQTKYKKNYTAVTKF